MKQTHMLTVVMPVYNERSTLREIIRKVLAVDLGAVALELVIVDDGSTDGTREILGELEREGLPGDAVLKVVYHQRNLGKGGAVRTGFQHATGDVVVIQDADLEYDPEDFPSLIQPILQGQVDVVYGSRRLKTNKHHSSYAFFLGGNAVTLMTNLLYGTHLTDEPTCYKTFRRELLETLPFEGNGFEWEPEITAKIAKRGIPIIEVPVSYYPRHISEGKKISWRDGVRAFWTLLKQRFTDGSGPR